MNESEYILGFAFVCVFTAIVVLNLKLNLLFDAVAGLIIKPKQTKQTLEEESK